MTDRERIEHIIESIELIEKFTKGYDKDRFFAPDIEAVKKIIRSGKLSKIAEL